jgi:hypothetical protein
MLSARSKGQLGIMAARQLATHPALVPPATKVGFSIVKPLAKRRARKQAERIDEAARTVAVTVATGATYAARVLDSLASQKHERTPALLGAGAVMSAGAVLGASAVYFFEPHAGREHREQVLKLVS